MGTALTGTTPQDTYDSLIKVTDNGPIGATAKYLSDGLGTDSVLALSTTAVGIGTAVPATKLDVRGSSGTIIQAKDSASYCGVVIDSGAASTPFTRLSVNAVGKFEMGYFNSLYYLNNTTGVNDTGAAMVITSTGNVGIGTSGPDGKLDVASAGNLVSTGVFTNPHLALTLSTAPTNNDTFVGMTLATSDNANYGWSFGAERTEAGLGNLGIRQHNNSATGTAIARFTSAGLCFGSDTAAANALDDYEEGTWTMGVTFGGASVGVTTSANTGTYTKIGRQVTVNGSIVLTSKGSSTGQAIVTGLPFTNGTGGQFETPTSLRITAITFADYPMANVNTNATTIDLTETTNAGVLSTLTAADFAYNSEIMISATYFV